MSAPGANSRFAGVVIRGDRRGRLLGFPTANLRLPPEAGDLPFGVYAGRALGHAAAVSIGVRPTFGDGLEPLAEVHVLDFEGDLYGQQLSVELHAYLRPERRFDTVEALKDQIAHDVAATRALIEGEAG